MDKINIGFLPLVDAALPILAREHGFAEEEGLEIGLIRDVSWASVLDRLLYGHSDAAHLLAPLAIATTLGRGRPAKQMAVPFVLGLNGNAITFSLDLADELWPEPGLADPVKLGERLKAKIKNMKGPGKLRFAVVHRHSSHNYKLRYWLGSCGMRPDDDVEIVTIAPPFAADALSDGEVDAICVGEPWNSVAVEKGAGRILLVTAQIWRRGVEKVLAMKNEYLEDNQELVERLIRALHRTGAHFIDTDNWNKNSSILARKEYLDGSEALIKRAISDRILLRQGDDLLHVPDFMFQHREAANFPWKSQAAWLYSQMLRWEGRPYDADEHLLVEAVFRSNIYRGALRGSDAVMPGASSKLEGALSEAHGVGSTQGRLILGADPFFDGDVFDPDKTAKYLGDFSIP